MITSTELQREIIGIFATKWKKRAGLKVPEAEGIQLGNDAVTLNATVMYADLAKSTELVDGYKDHFAAEVYKSYLVTTCRIIKDNGGTITAFDGDRVMAVFLGKTMNTDAVKTALQINYAVNEIINPALISQYPNTTYRIRQAVGIDTSDLLIAKTGIRGNNDLVWVGRAANYAAKLCTLREDEYKTYITKAVFDVMNDSTKIGGNPKKPMWEERQWPSMSNMIIYRSSWHWSF